MLIFMLAAYLLVCATITTIQAAPGSASVKGFPFLRAGKSYCLVLQGASDCGGDTITISQDAGNGWVRDDHDTWINLNLVSGLKETQGLR